MKKWNDHVLPGNDITHECTIILAYSYEQSLTMKKEKHIGRWFLLDQMTPTPPQKNYSKCINSLEKTPLYPLLSS